MDNIDPQMNVRETHVHIHIDMHIDEWCEYEWVIKPHRFHWVLQNGSISRNWLAMSP